MNTKISLCLATGGLLLLVTMVTLATLCKTGNIHGIAFCHHVESITKNTLKNLKTSNSSTLEALGDLGSAILYEQWNDNANNELTKIINERIHRLQGAVDKCYQGVCWIDYDSKSYRQFCSNAISYHFRTKRNSLYNNINTIP